MTGWRPRHPPGRADGVAAFEAPFVPDLFLTLRRRGWMVVDAEPAHPRLPAPEATRYGYGLGSFRTGPVATAARARLWLEAAAGLATLEAPFEDGGRWIDPIRPDLEPGGFASRAEALALRRVTLAAIRNGLARAHTVVLGLESADPADTAALVAALGRLGPARPLIVPLGGGLDPALARLGIALAPPLTGEALAVALSTGGGRDADPVCEEVLLDAFAPPPGR